MNITLGLLGTAGDDNLDARHMREERLWRLGMVVPAVPHRTCVRDDSPLSQNVPSLCYGHYRVCAIIKPHDMWKMHIIHGCQIRRQICKLQDWVASSRREDTIRGADCECSAVEVSAAAVAVFGCLVHNLIYGRVDIICKLDLCHRCHAHSCCANSKSHNALYI